MGKDLKGKKLPAGICQRKDGLYSARFTSKTGRRVEKFLKKANEAKKWLEDAKYEDKHNNIGASSQMTVDAWFDYWITEIKLRPFVLIRCGIIWSDTISTSSPILEI